MGKIQKVLIANRGEIACRVIRTCREMGIQTVAVYSEADRNAVFVSMADEAYGIGPAPSNESYLCIDKIIQVAEKSGADAIHPGYGFLSEKAEFSEACDKAGICFLGPKPDAISAMGDKVTAREWAQKAGLPMVPGTLEPVEDIEKMKTLAKEFGYPVLLKAAAGGGGKGMRVVHEDKEMESAYQQASSEALKSFGDGRMYLEKFVLSPRHVEVQLIRDQKGQAFFLLERECSMQRRHQKVIEEAPCSYLKEDVRQKLAEAALNLAHEIDYHGVGTVEFLVDAHQDFYFLEMNTRLQVEHCVTEMVTGLDLVRLQVLVGQGEALKLIQKDIQPRGHAIECRIYAEDPQNNFMPAPGKVQWLKVPDGIGIRHDTGVTSGSEISIYYDPMIAKLVVHAEDREKARLKMLGALKDYRIGGIKNNIPFLRTLLLHPEFINETMHTQFIDQNPDLTQHELKDFPWAVALGAAAMQFLNQTQLPVTQENHNMWWSAGQQQQLD